MCGVFDEDVPGTDGEVGERTERSVLFHSAKVDGSAPPSSRSLSLVFLSSAVTVRTAKCKACFVPMSTSSFLARVMPV